METANKLRLVNLDPKISSDSLFNICKRYGNLISVHRSNTKKSAILNYATEKDAIDTMPMLVKAGFQVNCDIPATPPGNSYQTTIVRQPSNQPPKVVHRAPNRRKICFYNLKSAESTSDLQLACSRYGNFEYFYRKNDRKTAFCVYKTESDAKEAYTNLVLAGYHITWAMDKVVNPMPSKQVTPDCTSATKSDFIACSFCGNEASSKCSRCSKPYCSKNCQDADWPQHQTQCVQIPLLESQMNDSWSDNNELGDSATIKQEFPTEMYGIKRPNPSDDFGQPVTKKRVLRIEDVSRMASSTVTSQQTINQMAPKAEHLPLVKSKRGVCLMCNELTREYCQTCSLFFCIGEKSNCFYDFHKNNEAYRTVHFASRNEDSSLRLCKNCNKRTAKFQCIQCLNEQSGKRAYFCLMNHKNCFEVFHKL